MPTRYKEDDGHHPSNWCAICGLYYCWHPESKDELSDRDHRAHGHKFKPSKTIDEQLNQLDGDDEYE